MCRCLDTCVLRFLTAIFASTSVFVVATLFTIAAPHISFLRGHMSSEMREQIGLVGVELANFLSASSSPTSEPPGERIKASVATFVFQATHSSETEEFVLQHWNAIAITVSVMLVLSGLTGLILLAGSFTNQSCLLCPWVAVAFLMDFACVFLLGFVLYLLATAGQRDKTTESFARWQDSSLKLLLVVTPYLSLQLVIVCALAKRMRDKKLRLEEGKARRQLV